MEFISVTCCKHCDKTSHHHHEGPRLSSPIRVCSHLARRCAGEAMLPLPFGIQVLFTPDCYRQSGLEICSH